MRFKARVDKAEKAVQPGLPFEPFTRPEGITDDEWHAAVQLEYSKVARLRTPYAEEVTDLYFDSLLGEGWVAETWGVDQAGQIGTDTSSFKDG